MSNGAQWGCRAESTVRAEMADQEMVLADFSSGRYMGTSKRHNITTEEPPCGSMKATAPWMTRLSWPLKST